MKSSIYLLSSLLVAGCASPAALTRTDPSPNTQAQAVASVEPGPFDVARDWARGLTVGEVPPPESIRQVVGTWSMARVARVWASGDQYRAVVVQKNTAGETPAVLLHITRGDAGEWEIAGAEPTTSTHLWSEL